LIHARGQIAFIQNTEHAFLAVHSGQKGNAQIEIASADLYAHAAVLGQTALGNIEAAHDLKARNQGDLKILRRRSLIDQDTVDTVAEANDIFERLHVNIACPVLDRLHQDQIGKLDNGRFLDGGGELVKIDFLDYFFDRFEILGLLVQLCLLGSIHDDVFHAAGFAGLQVVKLIHDRLLGGNHG